jgi:hypothetical protein
MINPQRLAYGLKRKRSLTRAIRYPYLSLEIRATLNSGTASRTGLEATARRPPEPPALAVWCREIAGHRRARLDAIVRASGFRGLLLQQESVLLTSNSLQLAETLILPRLGAFKRAEDNMAPD